MTTPALLRELAALRLLADAVREEEREPCGGTVHRMREALRDADAAQGRPSSQWMDTTPALLEDR